MLQWFQRLLPRQKIFFPLFERHAAVILSTSCRTIGMQLLCCMSSTGPLALRKIAQQ
jgi:hypothetical protein